jgi:hypothetical protein
MSLNDDLEPELVVDCWDQLDEKVVSCIMVEKSDILIVFQTNEVCEQIAYFSFLFSVFNSLFSYIPLFGT